MSKTNILLVDDDIDFLEMNKVQLEAAGFQVTTAESQRKAEKILLDFSPDIAIVDLMMENQDGGFTLCYLIKKKDPTLPVIMCSAVMSETGLGFDTTTDEERSWIKADVFLEKPVRFEQLKFEVDRLLEEKK